MSSQSPPVAESPSVKARCALLLVAPDPPPGLSPWHLLKVAGVPHLERLVLSCWQAGIPQVFLLAPPGLKPVLEQSLTRLRRRQAGSVELIPDWTAVDNQPPCSWLVLTADSVPSPGLLARLARHPLAPGEAAVVCTDDLSWPAEAPPQLPDLSARLEESGLPGWRAVGLALFSRQAWQAWHQWRRDNHKPRRCRPNPALLLEAGLKYLEKRGRLVAVGAEPFSLTYLARPEDTVEAGRRLAAGLSGSPYGEGWLESSLNRRLAWALLPLVARLPVLPTQITFLNLTLGLAAALLFLEGTYWSGVLGALLLPLVVVLDCLDGLLARLTYRETRLGRFLDFYGDTLLNLVIFLSISAGLYRMSGQVFYLGLLLILTTGYAWCWWLTDPHLQHLRKLRGPAFPAATPVVTEVTSRDYVYLLLLFALMGRLDWFILAVAAGSHFFAILYLLFLSERKAPRPPSSQPSPPGPKGGGSGV